MGQRHIKVQLAEDRYITALEGRSQITIQPSQPVPEGGGHTPLELLLISLSTCSVATIVAILRKMGKTITGCTVSADGTTRDEHPKSFSEISLDYEIQSPDARDSDVKRAIELAEAKYCPVWAMLKGAVDIKHSYTINK